MLLCLVFLFMNTNLHQTTKLFLKIFIKHTASSYNPKCTICLHALITWPLASEQTLICHITMHWNLINFFYNPGHVTLWCVEVGPMANFRESSTQDYDRARVICLYWVIWKLIGQFESCDHVIDSFLINKC